ISNKGAFGAFYRVWGDGKQMVKDDIFDYFGFAGLTADQLKAKGYIVWTPPLPAGAFIGEGDTFTYLNLLDNGLLGYQDKTIGGWAGDGVTKRQGTAGLGNAPVARVQTPEPNFTPAAQHDFATRMKWSVTTKYAEANHEPRVTIRGNAQLFARAGETVRLQATASDPDKNTVAVKWWQWEAVGTYPDQVTFSHPTALATSVQIPADATAGQTIHLVLEATDNGTPALTRYARVVVTVTR
ncbi:MAG: cadherin repeat domain-containing protein, partial [Acidobacteria bacterium]|nr:cadherin repeat domain-containing protein [Acidobacteriota bacterium]